MRQGSRVRYPISDVRCTMSDVRCKMSDVRYPISDVRCMLSGSKGFFSFFNSKFLILNSKLGFKAFTLIELIIFIIIAGIFLPATYVAFSASMRNATQPEDLTRGRLLAEQTMEVATKRGFTQLALDITSPPTCTAIGVTVPSGYTCAWTPSYINTLGGLTLSANNYIQISVTINTPQGNAFTSTGMVTNHTF